MTQILPYVRAFFADCGRVRNVTFIFCAFWRAYKFQKLLFFNYQGAAQSQQFITNNKPLPTKQQQQLQSLNFK